MAQVALNTRVSPETFAALLAMAAETGRSQASIVEAALKAYLETHTATERQKGD